ncbi:MAG: NADH-quinone oxidoreductase subunit [Verrucomicrobiota bacterium]|jgi:NADH-quinone oxidoreductase subunit N
MNYSELLGYLAPETLMVVAALGVLFVDLTTLRGEPATLRMRWAAWLTVFASAAAGVALFLAPQPTPAGYLDGMLVIDPLGRLVKIVLLILTACTALVSCGARFTEHAGEYFALLLLATVGMMILVSTENVLLIFVALELLSLSLYVLTAFNKQNRKSAEAALKYFLFGGMSAAFLLFGLSLVYGLTGELTLPAIAGKLAGKTLDPLLLAAILMMLTGFGFKVAAVPFHLWAPDTYEGAPLPSAAFIASGSKVASFFILAKVMMVGLHGAEGSGAWRGYLQGWVPVLAVIAGLSVVLGNLAAIAQKSVRRLLAYSAVAHAGYMLVGLMATRRDDGFASLLFYVTTYAVTTIGAFGVVAVVQDDAGDDQISSFAGLSRRAPLLSVCLMIFLLSLAGIPPLAGFFGKFYLFKAGLFVGSGGEHSLGLLWLVLLALAMSAVSLYYYLEVLKQVFVVSPAPGAAPVNANPVTVGTVALLAAGVVLLGCAPDLLVARLLAALSFP